MTLGIGIDFGTTNSVVAIAGDNGAVESFEWPTTSGPTDTFRTALMFWSEGRMPRATLHHVAGPQALERALSGAADQRFIQSIKTYLGVRSFSETRLFGQRLAIEELVAIFLRHMFEGHALATTPGAAVTAGRPVVFAGFDPDDALALKRLGAAYAAAGFADVDFAYEPLGAAYWYARDLRRDQTVLVADFGGGTSDFSVMRFERSAGRLAATPLAHAGVGVAGDTFDYRLIDRIVAPRLGKGAHYLSYGKRLPLPAYPYTSFAQWHQLSWLKSAQTLAELRRLQNSSDAEAAIGDLITLVEMDLGFELHRAVNRVKTALSDSDEGHFSFSGGGVRIEADIARRDFETWIAEDIAAIDAAMQRALASANVQVAEIDAVFLTGGTSYVPAVRRLFSERFGAERIHLGHAFQSVASGLALLAADRAREGRA